MSESTRLSRWIVPLLALTSLILAALLYGDTVAHSFFNDDPVYVRVVHDVTLTQLFTSRTANPFYRPINFAPLELLQMFTGRVSPEPLHLLGLILHALNGFLIALLARRLFPSRPLIPWLALALYITCPFSFQAVPYVAAMGHVQVATGILIAILCLESYLDSERWPWLIGIALGTAFANFAHENGVVTSALLAVWLFISRYELSFAKTLRNRNSALIALSPALIVNLGYLILWRNFSNNPAAPADILGSIPRNLLYFAQGLAYPISQFGYRLSTEASLSADLAAAILSGIGIVILLIGLILFRDRRILLGLAWFALTLIAPTILSDWFYVLTAPHILMMASPGIALAWAGALDAFWQRRSPITQTSAILILTLCIVGGITYVRERLDLQTRMDRLYREVYAEIAEVGNGVVFFNLPAWITPKTRAFALDSSGIVYHARYYAFADLVWANTELTYNTEPVLWLDNLPLYDAYHIQHVDDFQPSLDERVATVRNADRFYRVKALPTQFVLEEANPVPTSAADDGLLFSNQVRLLPSAYLIPDRHLVAVDLIVETIEGQVEEKLFVHLLCGEEIIAQADGALMGETYPYDYWSAGETWHEIRLMELPDDTPTSCLSVRIGQFHPVTQLRPTLPDGSEWTIIPVAQDNH